MNPKKSKTKQTEGFIKKRMPHKEKFLNKVDAKRLMKKLQMKYGADLQAIESQAKNDMEVYGYIKLETESMRQHLIEKIREHEKDYL